MLAIVQFACAFIWQQYSYQYCLCVAIIWWHCTIVMFVVLQV